MPKGQERFIVTDTTIIEQRFDNNGNITQHIEYANLIDPSLVINLPDDQVLAVIQAQPDYNENLNRTTFNFFDQLTQ